MALATLERMATRIIEVFDRHDRHDQVEQKVHPVTGDIVDVEFPTNFPAQGGDGELDIEEMDLGFAALVSVHPIDAIAFQRAADHDGDGKVSHADLVELLVPLTPIQRESLEIKLGNLEVARQKFSEAWLSYRKENVLTRRLKHHHVKELDHHYHEARLDFVAHLLEYMPQSGSPG